MHATGAVFPCPYSRAISAAVLSERKSNIKVGSAAIEALFQCYSV
jgi:hypothetical protein